MTWITHQQLIRALRMLLWEVKIWLVSFSYSLMYHVYAMLRSVHTMLLDVTAGRDDARWLEFETKYVDMIETVVSLNCSAVLPTFWPPKYELRAVEVSIFENKRMKRMIQQRNSVRLSMCYKSISFTREQLALLEDRDHTYMYASLFIFWSPLPPSLPLSPRLELMNSNPSWQRQRVS